MNKKILVLVVSFIASNLVAAHRNCFRPYNATITNKSGGDALVEKSHGIRGFTRKAVLPRNNSVTVKVITRGAELKLMAGPEENKSLREIEFYSKEPNVFTAQVILNPKGQTTSGFYTKNVVYSVKVINESGGIVKLTDTCGVKGAERSLADGKAITLSVQPGGYLMVQSGPENRKVNHLINFADQTGENPTITFVPRGFATSGIQSKNLEVQTQRIIAPRWFRRTQERIKETFKHPRKKRYGNGLNGNGFHGKNGTMVAAG